MFKILLFISSLLYFTGASSQPINNSHKITKVDIEKITEETYVYCTKIHTKCYNSIVKWIDDDKYLRQGVIAQNAPSITQQNLPFLIEIHEKILDLPVSSIYFSVNHEYTHRLCGHTYRLMGFWAHTRGQNIAPGSSEKFQEGFIRDPQTPYLVSKISQSFEMQADEGAFWLLSSQFRDKIDSIIENVLPDIANSPSRPTHPQSGVRINHLRRLLAEEKAMTDEQILNKLKNFIKNCQQEEAEETKILFNY